MFQQILYTRSKPKRELLVASTGKLGTGRVIDDEGHGIYNFSEKCLDEEIIADPLFVDTILEWRSASKELGSKAPGRFTAYSYYTPEIGKNFLIKDDSWQYYEKPFIEYAKDDKPVLHPLVKKRSNGQDHRPEEHIKQCIVGDFSNYVCSFLGSNIWNAFPVEENNYYHDNGEPLDFLPCLDDVNMSDGLVREEIKKFLSENRQECAKKLILTVITELSKNMDQRKFIVIKDYPENVEKWIACIMFSLPKYFANQISFRTNVVANENLSVENTYYVDKSGRFIKGNQNDAHEAGGKKKYFSMIVGIHPNPKNPPSICSGMNGVSFIYMDGDNRTIECSNEQAVLRDFYKAASYMDEDIKNFDKLLEELEHIEFGANVSDLYELFDGYKYLLDSGSDKATWNYDQVKKYLSIFKKYEVSPYKWSQYLAEKVYGEYSRFFETDINNGLSLLKQIISMDHASNLKGSIEKKLVQKYLCEVKIQNIDVKYADNFNKLINPVFTSISQLVFDGIKESIPTFIDTAEHWNSEQSYYIFTKVFESNNAVGQSSVEWYKEENNLKLISILFENIRTSDKYASDLLVYVKNAPIYLEFAVNGAYKDFDKWSRYICDSVVDSKLEMVCGAVLGMNIMTASLYEKFLILLLKANKQNGILFKFIIKANEKFGVSEDTSNDFVKEYLGMYARRPIELKALVDLMSENNLGSKTEELAYERITEFINDSTVDNQLKVLAKEYEKWRFGLKKEPGRAYVIVFADMIAGQQEESVIEILNKYGKKERLGVLPNDMNMVMTSIGANIRVNQVFVKTYSLLRDADKKTIEKLFSVDFKDAESIKWFLKIFLKRPFEDWAKDYMSDINEIKEYMYVLIKDDNVDKIEKTVMKSLDKNSADIEVYKEYFAQIKARIKEDKVEEKQRAKEDKAEEKQRMKEAKKEAGSTANTEKKHRLFAKLFGKK